MEDDIRKAGALAEPERSRQLRAIRTRVMEDLRRDLHGYRRVALRLHRQRRSGDEPPPVSSDPCGAVALKRNHLFNDFAHLKVLDGLGEQRDLFDF
ncbi:MAG: hypothetical protein GC155_08845 [Alphaproteobacteria bacterium]|nr:hypothetical protein [Alphaproteobacteria bacterium]